MKKIIHHVTKKLKEIKKRALSADDENKILINKTPYYKKEAHHTQKIEIEILSSTIVKILVILTIFMALQNLSLALQNILRIVAISFFLALGVAPIVNRIEQFKIPRPLAILLLYVIFFGIIGIIFVQLTPIIAKQLSGIAQDLTSLLTNIQTFETNWLPNSVVQFLNKFSINTIEIQSFISENLTSISKNLTNIAGSTFGILQDIFQGALNLLFTLVLLFFILMEREQISSFALLLLPHKNRSYVKDKFFSIQDKMAEWFKAQIILMIAVGIIFFLGMTILEIIFDAEFYPVTIALVAAFLELFPYLGLFITIFLTGLIALNISIVAFLSVLILSGIAQFLEGNILIPLIMEKVVGLSSVAVILALSIGGILGFTYGGFALSILGMILAIPIAASISIFVKEYANREDKTE